MRICVADSKATIEPAWRGEHAPLWLIVFVALWPLPGLAATVLALLALALTVSLIWQRWQGAPALSRVPAWRLITLLFLAYWLPQLLSSVDALDRARALRSSLADLRYLPFMWLSALAMATPARRGKTYAGLASIAALWCIDALAQALLGVSPLFWSLDQIKTLIAGHGFCSAAEIAAADRLGGVFGPCNLKFGQTLASLSPFLLCAARRHGALAWTLVTAGVAVVLVLAGARAAWITFALIALLSGWRLLGPARLALAALSAALLALAVMLLSPQVQQRIDRSLLVLRDGPDGGLDAALSGRGEIWQAAACMIAQHPFNGVGVRGFRRAYPACAAHPERAAAWGDGPALHAHQIVLEILSETGVIGLLLWLAGAVLAARAWRRADAAARTRAGPALLALAATVFPLNTHLAFYSTFWGALTLMLAALYAGALGGEETARC